MRLAELQYNITYNYFKSMNNERSIIGHEYDNDQLYLLFLYCLAGSVIQYHYPSSPLIIYQGLAQSRRLYK